MTFYFMGGEVGAFDPLDSSSGESASSAFLSLDGNFARGTVYASNTGGTSIETLDFSLPDEWWFHADIAKAAAIGSTEKPLINWRTASGSPLRLIITDTTIRVQAYISSTWTYVSDTFSVAMGANSRNTVDIHVIGNTASGTVEVYVEGTLRASNTGVDLSAVTGITHFALSGGSGSAGGLSQPIHADEPTVGMKLLTRYANGAGATTDFTGGYTEIDEIPYSDADFINSATNGDIELFTNTGPSISGYTVRAVGVYARAKKGASGPANLQLALRSAGTNSFSSSKALDVGYASYGHIWETDPATSAAWLSSAIDSLQFGVKAVT